MTDRNPFARLAGTWPADTRVLALVFVAAEDWGGFWAAKRLACALEAMAPGDFLEGAAFVPWQDIHGRLIEDLATFVQLRALANQFLGTEDIGLPN